MPAWIDEIKKRLDKANSAPWITDGSRVVENRVDNEGFMDLICRIPSERENNASFIAHSPEDITKLIQAVEVAENALEWYAGWKAPGKLARAALAQIQSGEFGEGERHD